MREMLKIDGVAMGFVTAGPGGSEAPIREVPGEPQDLALEYGVDSLRWWLLPGQGLLRHLASVLCEHRRFSWEHIEQQSGRIAHHNPRSSVSDLDRPQSN